MQHIDSDLRVLIEHAAAAGIGVDDIEQELIAPAHLPPDEHDALWLYALGRRAQPSQSKIRIVSG